MAKKAKSIIEYALIIALYYITGGAFSYINYSTKILSFFILSFLVCIIFLPKKINNKVIICVLGILSFLIMLPCIFFDLNNMSTYIAIIMQLCIGYFCAVFIPIEVFKEKFVRVIVFFAVISVFGFLVGMTFPSFATRFPLINNIDDASVNYYNAYIYVFMTPKGAGHLIMTARNAGICWEPGCYQMFLNVALFFLLDKRKNNKKNDFGFYFSFFVLIVTVITTVSTTGYILLILNLLFMMKSWFKVRKVFLILPIFFIIIFFSVSYFSFGTMFFDKITRELNISGLEKQNIVTRSSLDIVQYIFSDSFFIGMGFSKWLTFNKSLWNSVLHSFLCLGTPFTLMHIYGLYKGSKQLANRYLILFFIIIMSSFTETLFWRVLFDTVAFYGWLSIASNNKEMKTKYALDSKNTA